MASFKGHALPGFFFLFFGLWWSVKYPLKYFCRRKKHTSSVRSKAGFQRLEFSEAVIKMAFALIGMTAEQFVPEGPHLKLYNYEKKQWDHLRNWQHSTMYFFFALSGLVDIVAYSTKALPVALDRMVLSLAVFVEGLVFYYHIHGRTMLDFHVHQLLLVAIYGGAVCLFIEVFFRGILVLEMLRTSLCLLQGSWFWQIGFVLYPPSGSSEWNQTDHNNVMFLTMCFCWHYAFALLIIAMNYTIVNWVVRSKMKRAPTVEIGLLKTSERDQESEDEI
ncbi:transmembrane protein 45A isoform X2 [Hemicordylus capensis]|nr:transmembrane protein 45A isoform X2 [Hemicordylus capensis]XP_053166177.1 transmembrane protein 45A isoform X2 [Hemicordylus capensis]